MTQRFPLAWPAGWRRMAPEKRTRAQFGTAKLNTFGNTGKKPLTVAVAIDRLTLELDRLGVEYGDMLVSSNLELRLDGWPKSDQREPHDPGVAVYWKAKGEPSRVMAIDRYDRVADNLGAVAATLEAMRAIERHGGGAVLERAFTGFDALPAPGRSCWEILDIPRSSTPDQINQRFKYLARINHPDAGGTHEAMAAITNARNEALEQCRLQ